MKRVERESERSEKDEMRNDYAERDKWKREEEE